MSSCHNGQEKEEKKLRALQKMPQIKSIVLAAGFDQVRLLQWH